jgi:hypothetical protein
VTMSTATTTTTTKAAAPSCSFTSGQVQTNPGIAVALGYSTTNATSAQICSSGGTCKTTSTGSNKTFSATPTSSNYIYNDRYKL